MRHAPPKSASGVLTGFAGLLIGTLTMYAVKDWAQSDALKTVAVVGTTALAMIVIDFTFYRSTMQAASTLEPQAVRTLDLTRIAQKLIGFWATIAIVGFIYWIFPEYWGDFYAPAKTAALFGLPILLVISPFYVAYVDMKQNDPDDAYVQLARLIGGTMPANWEVLGSHARGWVVKGFFLPLMFTFLCNDLTTLWSQPTLPEEATFSEYFERLYALLYLWDVMISTVGYILTLKLLGSQIKSAEPTILGWAVCLLCYPPFWAMVSNNYLAYDIDDASWGEFLEGLPVLYTLWGVAIIVLTVIYVWATVSFGLKFSNLTHRGIITHGPYRWVKHPAYLSKNVSWWLVSVPFLTTGDWTLAVRSCVMLGLVNAVYFARARTEERHLSRDSTYVEYQAFIAEHGLWANIRSWIGLRRGWPIPSIQEAAVGRVSQPSHPPPAALPGSADRV